MPPSLPSNPNPNPDSDSGDYLLRIPLGTGPALPEVHPPTDWTPARPPNKRSKSQMQTPQVLILGFALLILLGTLLLKLPASSADPSHPIGWMDAFFTATSAITVTGLAVRVTALDFSRVTVQTPP